MYMVTVYETKVIDNVQLSPTVHRILLKPKKPFSFVAGQFINVRVGSEGKPYSIASAPDEKYLELCIKRAGHFSGIMDDLRKGKVVNIIGPNGAFTLTNSKGKELIFVATGTGIAPIKSMITDLLHKSDKRKITLYFGVRKQSGILYKKLFTELSKKHENFNFISVLSRPPASWKGAVGHVDNIIKEQVKNAKNKDIFMCGLPAMVEGVEKLARQIGFKETQIFREKFV